MKSIVLSLTILLTVVKLNAQNLVPNAGFELNSGGCPTQINQVNRADGWSTWAVTPDYFHSCSNATHPQYGVPYNVRGYQQAHSGQAYIGLFTYSDIFPNLREFVGRQLSQPLTIGQQYFVSMWICKTEQLLSSHSANKIGFRFSTVPFTQADPDTALNNAHVFSATIMSDTANWTLVSGSFTADSAYGFIGIGNYFDDANTQVDTGDATANYAYYLIDDICVSIEQAECFSITNVSDRSIMDQFEIYPNPVSDLLYLQAPVDDVDVEVYDALGRLVITGEYTSSARSISVSHLTEGAYAVLLIMQDEVVCRRFIKRVN